jgi:hypothetical protein
MVNDFVFAGLEQLVHGRRFLVAGDWNVARSVDDRYPGSPGSEFFRRTEERGWFECLPEGGQEVQTWFGGGAPYQDDHAFCDPDLRGRLSKVWVAAEAASDLRLSHPRAADHRLRHPNDHRPVVIHDTRFAAPDVLTRSSLDCCTRFKSRRPRALTSPPTE